MPRARMRPASKINLRSLLLSSFSFVPIENALSDSFGLQGSQGRREEGGRCDCEDDATRLRTSRVNEYSAAQRPDRTAAAVQSAL